MQAQLLIDKPLTVTEGLANNTLQCITQDQQGFLWLGTQDGLSRYDGRAFRTFRSDARRKGSLAGNFVRALLPAAAGGLWVGTDYGLSYYNARTEQFARVPTDTAATYFVNALLTDANGYVWVGTEDGLLRYHPPSRQLRRFRCEVAGPFSSAARHNSIRCLALASNGTLWAGTGEGQLCRFDLATHALRAVPNYSFAMSQPITALAATATGLWVGTEEGGLYYLPPAGFTRQLVPSRVGGAAVHSLQADARGGVWVGTSAGLCYWRSATTLPTAPVFREEVLALSFDQAAQLWVGSATGLRRLDTQPSPFRQWPANFAAGPAWAVATAPNGAVWLGTEQHGLLRLHAQTGIVMEHLDYHSQQSTGLASSFIRCVLADADGGLWVGTQHQGLDYRPPGATGFQHFRHTAGQAGSLADDFVRCLYRDPQDGALWVGTEGGLCRLATTNSATFTTYQRQANKPEGLPNNFVRCVLRDRAGQLWVGTGGGGLCRLDDPRTGRFTVFRANAHDEHSLPGNFVRTLGLDATGRLWVGTEDGGLGRLDDSRTGRFTTFSEAQGLPNSVIYSLVPDSAARALWVSTNRGLARLDLSTERLTAFDAHDGLPQQEYNAGAGCRGPDGRLYFGGPTGLVSFQPRALPPPAAPRIVLTGLRRLNQLVVLADTAVGQRRQLRLGPRDYVFTLEFAALDLRRASHHKLLYRLEGFDPSWLAAGEQREATYTNLNPGRYLFRVREATMPPTAGALLGLVVEPPWYGTWWFRLLAGSTLCLAAWAAYQVHVSQLLALERMRHRIARDLHDDIGSTLSSISILSTLAHQQQRDHHPAQVGQLLTQIGDSSRRMLDAMDDIVWAINPTHDSLADVTTRMRVFAAELFEACNTELVFDADPTVAALRLPMERRREFFLLFKEAVINLAKYAHAQHAHITLTHSNSQLWLLVADDGVGFDPAIPAQGSGNGLPNMRARAAALGGRLTLLSMPGQGTTVQLRIPI